jgi:hypothetical protein
LYQPAFVAYPEKTGYGQATPPPRQVSTFSEVRL